MALCFVLLELLFFSTDSIGVPAHLYVSGDIGATPTAQSTPAAGVVDDVDNDEAASEDDEAASEDDEDIDDDDDSGTRDESVISIDRACGAAPPRLARATATRTCAMLSRELPHELDNGSPLSDVGVEAGTDAPSVGTGSAEAPPLS